jgi:tetratricopeptide (TPR) repeat protein
VSSPRARYGFQVLAAHGLLGVSVLGMCAVLLGAPKLAAQTPNGQATAGTANAPDFSQTRPLDPLNATALERFYNLDYDRAVQGFQRVLERHPDDPFAVNHLLSGIMYRELYRMGLLDPGDYADDSFLQTPHRPADAKVVAQIKGLVERAEGLEEARLKVNPNDVDALYARGVTRAQFATYTGLVERAWISALRNAVGARKDHERVLELSPRYIEAKLVVGVHNYVMGSLPVGLKVAISLVGLGGSREKGIEYLQEVARSRGENSTDARIALVLFLRRDQRYQESLDMLHGLLAQYPQNVILALEEGSLLRSLHRNTDAEATYRKIWQNGRAGYFGGSHYEFAALYLGDLLRAGKDFAGAAAAYELVNEVAKPDPEVLQKANLGAGEMYDLERRRDLAVKKYDAVIAANGTSRPADTARRRLKEPYRAD